MEFKAMSKILFVGEGDFSFTEALSRTNCFDKVEVIATCYQEELKEKASINIQNLKKRGVDVITGIDATMLHKNKLIKNCTFAYVVFNFPHVGGKMKIHLNRALLCGFFKSAVYVLQEGGQILVTLCAGQGGIPLDPETRRWDDTWQVVLMASRADLVLRKIDKFNPSRYIGYSATGYRSLEKGFMQTGAITYFFESLPNVFTLYNPIKNALGTEDVLLSDGSFMKIPNFALNQIERDLCSDTSTLIGQLCFVLQKHISRFVTLQKMGKLLGNGNLRKVIDKCIMHYSMYRDRTAFCHPLYVLKRRPVFEIDIFLLFIFPGKLDILETILSENILLEMRNFNKHLFLEQKILPWRQFLLGPYSKSFGEVASFKMFSPTSKDSSKDLHTYAINIKRLAETYLAVEGDEIWAHCQMLKVDDHSMAYSPHNLFPLEYVYDLSFWQCAETRDSDRGVQLLSMKEAFTTSVNLDAVGVIIKNVAQDSLLDYRLLSTYFHPIEKKWSFTFRIRYRSFYRSLSDCKAKEIHSYIGEKLEEHLSVKVR